jgi:adenine C2-methylase RlmN of 23S rRNA A2503 and tRNA A37
MRRLSDEMPYISLALSLHAPNQEVRLKIVPAASAHHIDKLMAAVDYHVQRNRYAHSERQSWRATETEEEAGIEGKTETGAEVAETSSDAASVHASASASGGTNPVASAASLKRQQKLCTVMIEYILIRDVNDRVEHAEALTQLLGPRREYVMLNLIPYNPTEVTEEYDPPLEGSVE